jgi:hypothetical protein
MSQDARPVPSADKLLRTAPIFLGSALVLVAAVAVLQGLLISSPGFAAAGGMLAVLGILVAVLSNPRYRNRIVMELGAAGITLSVLTLLFALMGLFASGPSSPSFALMLLVYIVLGSLVLDRSLRSFRHRHFMSTDHGFQATQVPLRRLLRGKAFVDYAEVLQVIVRNEPDGKRVAYVFARDGTTMMLRQADGVPADFIDTLVSRILKPPPDRVSDS